MKYTILIFVLSLGLLNSSMAQETPLQWFENIEEATSYAVENDANILMVFAGSDWCKPCIKFKKEILEANDFKAWAASNVAVLYLDFPARKKNKLSPDQTAHNEALAEKYNKSGAFPNIFLLDKETSLVANPSFKGQSVSDFIALLGI